MILLQRPGFGGNRNQSQQQQQQQQQQPTLFEKNVAAAKLAAAFRGRLGRKQAAQVKRNADAEEMVRRADLEEVTRPKPRQITRPKGKSYIGF